MAHLYVVPCVCISSIIIIMLNLLLLYECDCLVCKVSRVVIIVCISLIP